MWRAIEEFLPSVDPSVLDLRLNRVRNVGEIELYDTDLQFVDVSDLPGSAIEFDVVMDATLIIHDEDRYHNDESEAAHQWFMIRCRGDLDRKLSDLEIYDVCVYNRRNHQKRPMSNALVPIIYKDDLEKGSGGLPAEVLQRSTPSADVGRSLRTGKTDETDGSAAPHIGGHECFRADLFS